MRHGGNVKTYYVLWTYIANFSKLMSVQADSPREALDKATGLFSSDFKHKGNVYVFDRPPVLVQGSEADKY